MNEEPTTVELSRALLKALLDKLKHLVKEDRIFQGTSMKKSRSSYSSSGDLYAWRLTTIAQAVIFNLCDFLKLPQYNHRDLDANDIDWLIKTAEEFLRALQGGK
jgi:hypothetical protein